MKILVTGSDGFLGKNLCAALKARKEIALFRFDKDNTRADLDAALECADIIFHLAGVNRPQNVDELKQGNTDFTESLCSQLLALRPLPTDLSPLTSVPCSPLPAPCPSPFPLFPPPRPLPLVVFSSSIQAVRDNPYGQSKRGAEAVLENFAAATGARVVIHRFSNLFGKWSRPNYNTVTATFCHNIARDMPIQISDPSYRFDLSYVDDVVEALLAEIESAGKPGGCTIAPPVTSHNVSLGELAALIRSFKEQRTSLLLPDFGNPFVRKLYATYLSFLPHDQFAYNLLKREDDRGSLAEFIKTEGAGQMFVSRTHPGITRGNHYHHTKVEKFLVVEGEGIVRFRSIQPIEPLRLPLTPSPSVPGAQPLDPSPSHLPLAALPSVAGPPLPAPLSPLLEYRVRGEDYRVVDIPPGYTHSIENTGKGEMVTLFWASEVFDPAKPDTYFETVL